METNTTRRALIVTAAAAMPVVSGVTVLKDEREVYRSTERACIETVAGLHPNGRRVALEAYRCDVDWARIKEISLEGPNAPVLRFGTRPGSAGGPQSEIVVSMAGAFLHGPVGLDGGLL